MNAEQDAAYRAAVASSGGAAYKAWVDHVRRDPGGVSGVVPPEVTALGGCVNDCGDDSFRCPEDLDYVDWCPWCQANEEPPGAGADPYGRTAEDWARHAE